MPRFERFHLDVVPDRTSVSVLPCGELDLATRDQLSAEVLRLRDAGFERIAIDLVSTSFMDSSALITLFRLSEVASDDGWALEIRRPSDHVQRLFELTGLAGRFEIAA